MLLILTYSLGKQITLEKNFTVFVNSVIGQSASTESSPLLRSSLTSHDLVNFLKETFLVVLFRNVVTGQ